MLLFSRWERIWQYFPTPEECAFQDLVCRVGDDGDAVPCHCSIVPQQARINPCP